MEIQKINIDGIEYLEKTIIERKPISEIRTQIIDLQQEIIRIEEKINELESLIK